MKDSIRGLIVLSVDQNITIESNNFYSYGQFKNEANQKDKLFLPQILNEEQGMKALNLFFESNFFLF